MIDGAEKNSEFPSQQYEESVTFLPIDGAEQKAEFPSQPKEQNGRIIKASMRTEYKPRNCIARRNIWRRMILEIFNSYVREWWIIDADKNESLQ